jgi:hypothetical protein
MTALRLTDRELVVAVEGLDRPDPTRDPDATATLRVIARALVRVELRRSFGDAVVELRAWADEHEAVTGRVEGDAVELRRAPREALPPALVRAAGLAGGAGPDGHDGRAPLPVGAAALLAARDHLRTGDRAAAAEQLRGAQDVEAALAVADTIRHSFVAQGSWREPDGEWHAGAVAALDAGPGGWWSFVPGAADGALEPTDADALSARLVGLIP